MNAWSKYRYYLSSVRTLLTGLDDPWRTAALFLGLSRSSPAEIRLRRSGWRFHIRTAMDAWIIKETCLDEEYLWAAGSLQRDWTVVDIGAGLGDFTVYAAKACSAGIVHAYEPLADSFTLLQHNLALNGVDNVHVYQSAVSAAGGSLSAERLDGLEAVSTRFREASGHAFDEREVTAVSLRHILDTLPSGKADFLKIDCEGCEFDLLLNSPAELLDRIERISLEYHDDAGDYRHVDLVAHLQRHGFAVQTRANPVHSHLGLLYARR